jgi:hypothetical protein
MRKMIRASLLAIAALSVNAVADELNPQTPRETAERYTIDSARTVVSFEVRSFGFLRHRGLFRKSSGSVFLDPQADEGTFDVVIDARSIQAGNDADLKIMRGAGFLNVEKFPEISPQAQCSHPWLAARPTHTLDPVFCTPRKTDIKSTACRPSDARDQARALTSGSRKRVGRRYGCLSKTNVVFVP